ncbi:MAG: GIY-YIG nuclease family protein, partial [Patescibacteria group bacterium]
MKWYVYIVECADKMLYTGTTIDLARRIKEHNYDNTLGSRYVRVRRPV